MPASSEAPPLTRAPKPVPKPGILDIHAYTPGKATVDGVADPVKLSSNENILGSSPLARAAFVAAVDSLHMYPDGQASALRAAVAAHFSLEPERLVFGDGSDELLHLLNQVFIEPGDNIVMGQYGFSAYSIGARACQGEVRHAAEPNYKMSGEEILAQVDDRTRLVFITQPANPTGTFLTRDELEALHAGLRSDVVLVLDGAYAEFATDPRFDVGMDLARGHDNVVVTRTFSKLHGLAALRIGWAYCPEPIADAVDRIRAPFNTSIAAQQAAVAALADVEFQERSREHVATWRPWLTQQLGGLGLEVVPSQANFVLVEFPTTPGRTSTEAEAFLASRGLIVRGVSSYGLPAHLRITIGLEEHNRAVVDALSDFLKA
ncbi:histidinol-phosphate transaminase [uncultured Phenylobacterium sp.]|uniref:histidinol-phosphate transaminase n=1 Tax=uncultured Phenylobacterium sp. TaxID=349273 RepID=UPI0025DB9001|nr:histidinol-phosphate transaminase [uncultured Phenylobacterium sp.]